MKIQQLRKKIDTIDKKLLNLFEKRMKCSIKIVNCKISNNKNVSDFKRENEILKTIKKSSTPKFTNSNKFLFSTIMNVSKLFQYHKIKTLPENIQNMANNSIAKINNNNENNLTQISPPNLGCLETNDNYSKIATSKAFPNSTINTYNFLSDFFNAIHENVIDFGVIEINTFCDSTTNNIYEIINEKNIFINQILNLNASYCLAVNPKNKGFFNKIISTNQILNQCSKYINKCQYEKSTLNLIFESAFLVSKLEEPLAVICPKEVALEYNLKIIDENVQDNINNNKKFVVVSKNLYTTQNPNILSLAIKIHNINKFLSNISSYLVINNINLLNLQIKPDQNQNNHATIYLNFTGNIQDKSTKSFINYLSYETCYLKLLGSYNEENI